MSMAAVLRLKRRRCEEHVDNLVVEYKKCKTADTSENEKFFVGFLTTVDSPGAAISKSLKKALNMQHLKENFKVHRPCCVDRTTENKRKHSAVSRYKIVHSNRSINLQDLQYMNSIEPGNKSTSVACNEVDVLPSRMKSDMVEDKSVDDYILPCASHGNQVINDDEDINVYDLVRDFGNTEHDDVHIRAKKSLEKFVTPQITLNGEVLQTEPLTNDVDSEFVYDLYCNLDRSCDPYFRQIENILSIEAHCGDFVLDDSRLEECVEVYDDEDDSNNEDNWRNDYPDYEAPSDDTDKSEISDICDDFVCGEEFSDKQTGYAAASDDILSAAMKSRLNFCGSGSDDSTDEDDVCSCSSQEDNCQHCIKRTSKHLEGTAAVVPDIYPSDLTHSRYPSDVAGASMAWHAVC